MAIKFLELSILLVLALISDIKSCKIKNTLTVPFMIVAIVINSVHSGMSGLIDSLLGISIPVILLFILFGLRMLSAGDIKLFCAIGSIMGMNFVLETICFSFLAGGLIGLAVMTIRGNIRERTKFLHNYLKTCLITFSISEYVHESGQEKSGLFRFAYAIAAGSLVALNFHFLL